MKNAYKGKLVQGDFVSPPMTVELSVMGQQVKQAVGEIEVSDQLLRILLNPVSSPMFEFCCDDGSRFNLVVERVSGAAGSARAKSSGPVPGM